MILYSEKEPELITAIDFRFSIELKRQFVMFKKLCSKYIFSSLDPFNPMINESNILSELKK